MLFSIVVPVYNVECYLDECLQSIVSQINTIEDECEIILVDDGSTDNSGKICDAYKQKYPDTIKVYHKENQGLLLTRRYGFKKSSGTYIINCDSDDLLENGMLENLRNIITKYKEPDMILINHNSYDGVNKKNVCCNIFTEDCDCRVSRMRVLKELMRGHYVVSMWGKIYKRSCIDNCYQYEKFGHLSTGEDTLQSIELFDNAETYVYFNKALYNYRSGSGMTVKFDPNYFFTFKNIFIEIEKKRNSWNLENFNELFAVKVLQTAGRAITQSRYNDWATLEEHKEYLKRIREDDMLTSNLRYIGNVKHNLQRDHYILLKILNSRLYVLIIFLLAIRNKVR